MPTRVSDEKIREAHAHYAAGHSLAATVEKMGFGSPWWLSNRFKKLGLTVRGGNFRKQPIRYRNKVHSMVRRGLTTNEIGKKLGISGQAVRKFLRENPLLLVVQVRGGPHEGKVLELETIGKDLVFLAEDGSESIYDWEEVDDVSMTAVAVYREGS
jgi:hypothetical protein